MALNFIKIIIILIIINDNFYKSVKYCLQVKTKHLTFIVCKNIICFCLSQCSGTAWSITTMQNLATINYHDSRFYVTECIINIYKPSTVNSEKFFKKKKEKTLTSGLAGCTETMIHFAGAFLIVHKVMKKSLSIF